MVEKGRNYSGAWYSLHSDFWCEGWGRHAVQFRSPGSCSSNFKFEPEHTKTHEVSQHLKLNLLHIIYMDNDPDADYRSKHHS